MGAGFGHPAWLQGVRQGQWGGRNLVWYQSVMGKPLDSSTPPPHGLGSAGHWHGVQVCIDIMYKLRWKFKGIYFGFKR